MAISFLLCILLAQSAGTSLDQGSRALADFRVEEAIVLLEKAREEGPYRYNEHIRLYEQLGIAYAYLDKKGESVKAFDMMLALDPGHALSYTLSPKVTFLFEQARKQAASRQPALIELNWPRNLKVHDRVALDVEVVADPKGFLKQAELHTRRKGTAQWSIRSIQLAGVGRYQQIELPPVARETDRAEVLQLYLVASDPDGNQVLMLGDPARPREISLSFEEPEAWYRKWWVWALVGGVVAAGTGTAVYFGLQEPPDRIHGTFQLP